MSAPSRIRPAFHCLPRIEAGARMPSHAGILAGDTAERENAVHGSRALLRAIDLYFRRGGRA